MTDSYNDDREMAEHARITRWSQYKDMRLQFSLKGKPSQYRINLISLGRVGYSFARQLLEYMKSDPSFLGLTVWHPISRQIEAGQPVDIHPKLSKSDMNNALLGIMTGEEERVKLVGYRTLHDLEEIVRTNLNDPSRGDITVVAARYDFSFDLKSKNKKGKEVTRPLNPKDPADLSLIDYLIHRSVYDVSQNPEATMKRVLEERSVMQNIVTQVMRETGLQKDRAKLLIDSVIGIRELAKVMQGYRGNTIIATNEVDTTAYVFAKQSHTDPRKTLGLSHNDQLRYEKFLRDALPRALRTLQLYVPIIGSHNQFLTPVEELIRINGHPLYEAVTEPTDIARIRQHVIDFGEALYRARGASDEDAPKAILHMIRSIMYEDFREDHVIRASTRFGQEDFFTGMQLTHDNELAIPQLSDLRVTSAEERAIFDRGVEVQKYINQLLVAKGIIPAKWEFEEFKPQAPPRVEIIERPATDIRFVPDRPLEKEVLKGTIYSLNTSEPLVVCALDLANPDINQQRKVRVCIKDYKYEKKVGLRRVFLHGERLFVEGLYEDNRGIRRSHLLWFDTSAGLKQEGEQSFDLEKRALVLLYQSHYTRDTVAFAGGYLYCLLEEQDGNTRLVKFNPQDTKAYKIIGQGLDKEERLRAIVSVKDEVIVAGTKNFYRLDPATQRLQFLCQAECKPVFLRSLDSERLVAYSDGATKPVYFFNIDSTQKHTKLEEGPCFELSKSDDLCLTTLLNCRVQQFKYGGQFDLLQQNQKDYALSAPVANLQRAIVAPSGLVIALAQSGNTLELHPLDSKTLKPRLNKISMPHSHYLSCEMQLK